MDESTSSTGFLEEEGLDPRVHIELEKLNVATDEINHLEATLEEANNSFRASLNETSNQLQSLAKRLGSSIEKARPYYEATERAKKLQLDCQRAAVQFQRANVVHQAARETIALAEERFTNLRNNEAHSRQFDSAWQEMLNHATMKIMEAEAQKSASEREHLKIAAAYTANQKEVRDLERSFKTSINKSRPYFHHRAATQIQLEAQKNRIHKLQKEITLAKLRYSLSLQNLEQISEEIHENRRANMKREPGVGAEFNDPPTFVENELCEETADDVKIQQEHQYWKDLRYKLDELREDDERAFNENPKSSVTNSVFKLQKNNFSALPHNDNMSESYEGLIDCNDLKPEVFRKIPFGPCPPIVCTRSSYNVTGNEANEITMEDVNFSNGNNERDNVFNSKNKHERNSILQIESKIESKEPFLKPNGSCEELKIIIIEKSHDRDYDISHNGNDIVDTSSESGHNDSSSLLTNNFETTKRNFVLEEVEKIELSMN